MGRDARSGVAGRRARPDELEQEDWVRGETAERLRGLYTFRADRFRARFDDEEHDIESRSQDFQRLRRELLEAEREAILELRRTGVIGNDAWLSISRDLDLEDQRLDS